MRITNKIKKAIENMSMNPHHKNIRPSNLISSNTAYSNLNSEQINFCKEKVFGSQSKTAAKVATRTPVDKPTVTNVDSHNGKDKQTIESPYPLNADQLADLVGADGINVRVDRIWSKSHKNGVWTYSVLTVTAVKDFYSRKELEKRLSQILPKSATIKLPKVAPNTNRLLTLTLADIHAGSLGNELTPFPTEYSKKILMDRLSMFSKSTMEFVGNNTYEEVWLVNLGDSINSWQGHTTRKGHDVPSESNKVQFDIFVESMAAYYKTMFESGLAKKYKVISCLNDNHAGIDLSYMATRAVELYIGAQYPQVEFIHQEKFIEVYSYGKHNIAMVHGKDEKLMKYGWKAILDERLDNWLNQFFLHRKHNPTEQFNHVYKGDLHLKNEQFGKFGRYLNFPSVMGTSDYIALNYGFSGSGAVIEEFKKDSKNVKSENIWFQ